MFQRIKGAIDRTIAEEQARQKNYLSEQGASGQARQSSNVSRSNSGASTAGRKPRPKKPAQDASKEADAAASNPDPAVFEAAFVIDDDDELSRTTTLVPPSEEKEKTPGEEGGAQDEVGGGDDEKGDTGAGNTAKEAEKKGGDDGSSPDGDKPVPPPKPAAAATAPELPPEVRAKLRKLEKLEATYPGEPVPVPELSETREARCTRHEQLTFLPVSPRASPILPHCPRPSHFH